MVKLLAEALSQIQLHFRPSAALTSSDGILSHELFMQIKPGVNESCVEGVGNLSIQVCASLDANNSSDVVNYTVVSIDHSNGDQLLKLNFKSPSHTKQLIHLGTTEITINDSGIE